MELLVIRHGRPERVEATDGPADPPLTKLGHEQAKAVARFLLAEQIDLVVSSPMLRARQTAEPLADALGTDPTLIDDLAEIDKDATSYLPTEEIKATDPVLWQQWLDNPMSQYADEFEPFQVRVLAAFDRLIVDNPGRNVAVFCHGMVTMTFVHSILGFRDVFAVPVDYASITRVAASSNKGVRSVRSINETAHLGPTRVVL
jgi:2,3-bisphosphoglycerate-dependent phosphoglycerate mutase